MIRSRIAAVRLALFLLLPPMIAGCGTAFRGEQGRGALERGDYDSAIADFSEAIAADPKDADAYRDRGLAYSRKGDFDRAIDDETDSVLLDQKDAVAYDNRGFAYFNKRDYEQAIVNYSQAISVDPEYESAYWNRGLAYSVIGNYDGMIADFTQVLALNAFGSNLAIGRSANPGSNESRVKAYDNRGVAYALKGDYGRALADLNRAAGLDATDAQAHLGRGLVHYLKGERDQAIADFSEAIRLDPNNAGAYGDRGDSYSATGDYARAIADYSEAIKRNPKEIALYDKRGDAYYASGDRERAAGDYQTAARMYREQIAADPKDWVALGGSAWMLATCPDGLFRGGDKAAEYARRACDLAAQQSPSCLDTMAAADAESGNFYDAIKSEQDALAQTKGENPEYRKRLDLYQDHKPYRTGMK